MEMLGILEKKIASLVDFVNRLKVENNHLAKDLAQAKSEYVSLKTEHEELVESHKTQGEEFSCLKGALAEFENSVLASRTSIDEFKNEKDLTLMLVDDIIKSIDSLVENDSQS